LADLTPVTLTFDLVTPKSKGFLCCPGRMCGPSLRKVGQDVLELLIGNEKVTDGPTEMCKAICPAPSSLKKGIKTHYQLI